MTRFLMWFCGRKWHHTGSFCIWLIPQYLNTSADYGRKHHHHHGYCQYLRVCSSVYPFVFEPKPKMWRFFSVTFSFLTRWPIMIYIKHLWRFFFSINKIPQCIKKRFLIRANTFIHTRKTLENLLDWKKSMRFKTSCNLFRWITCPKTAIQCFFKHCRTSWRVQGGFR